MGPAEAMDQGISWNICNKIRIELDLKRFEELRLMLKKRFRSQVLCHGFESGMLYKSVPRNSSVMFDSSLGRNDFEVHLDGFLIFSKRRSGYFPDLDLIVSEVRMVLEDPSHEPRTVTETESCCSFRYTSCCQVS